MKLVKATKRGFDGICIREIGDQFPFANPDPHWMEVIGEVEEAQAESDVISEEVTEEKPKKSGKAKAEPAKPKATGKGKAKAEPTSEPEGQDVL